MRLSRHSARRYPKLFPMRRGKRFGYRRWEGACVQNGPGCVHLNIPRPLCPNAVKVSTKGISVAGTVPLVSSLESKQGFA